MKGDKIYYYRRGKFYVLSRTYTCYVGVFPPQDIVTDFVILTKDGWMTLMKGYAWDGPSGPTIDTKSTLRASLIHDGLYQLMRLGLLELIWRDRADDLLRDIMIEDKAFVWRAKLWRYMVDRAALSAATNKEYEKELVAP